MWGLSGPGIEPMSSVLAGRFLTTGPPGKSQVLPELLSEQKVKVLVPQWCLSLCNPMDLSLVRLLCPWDSPLSSQAVLPVCVSVSRLLSSCDTSHIGLGPAQCQCDFILTTFAMTKNKDFIMWISEAYTSTCNKWVLRIGKALFSALPLHPPHLWWLCTIIWCAFTRNCLVSNLNSF